MKDTKHIPFEYSYSKNASKDSFTQSDNRNCAVTAIANLFNIDYLVAYAVLANNGRNHGKGTELNTTLRAVSQLCEQFGYEYKRTILPVAMKSSVIAVANKDNKDARILMRTKGHIFAFVDCKIHDSFIDDRKVYEIISIQPKINYSQMATNIKNLTQHEREVLINELSGKIMRKSFIKDQEREDAVKLLNMLSKYEASDAKEIEDEEIKFTKELDLDLNLDL